MTASPLAPDAQRIRAILTARQRRARHFDRLSFRDPAWDMILALGHAHATGCSVDTIGLTQEALIPSTTALRHIGVVEASGYARRDGDPLDLRRSLLTLTDEGARALSSWLADVAAASSGSAATGRGKIP